MASINIQLPAVEGDQQIEVDVKINGKKRKMHYRIEIFSWEECEKEEEKANCLRNMISNYDEDWRLINIGSPTEATIPLMFKQLGKN